MNSVEITWVEVNCDLHVIFGSFFILNGRTTKKKAGQTIYGRDQEVEEEEEEVRHLIHRRIR